MELLKGKTAIITGCNRGIGRATLEKFCAYGADVFALVRQESESFLQDIEKLKAQYGVEIIPIYADFKVEDEVKQAVKSILSYKKNIDILVNNIGIANPQAMFTMTKMETIKDAFQVNLFSSILLTQLISRSMLRNKKGSIIFVSSSAAFDGGANIEYSASKAAIIGAAKRIAKELCVGGIRVNVVAPGLTSTDMGNSMSEEDEKVALSMNLMKRKGQPSEIADAIAFLASDMASFITAQVLRVDGGLN
ncbi:MAG: SDR family oxidoreductase [Succinivibrio sp.]|nr:SDR family oxidoreductase [Succinivibrio sp.]MDD7288060.1 SDR family NAD(P)-dependent oxidoreductase [Succinivibrio sp.]MDY3107574.1 SDR family oxidoreductase [Succinivibrio sp.]MDY4993619.1 SDR family oxidoreductase [Succinivibrio sp.]MDY5324888.1 SDR family oxidoreductase [Succinivibrio sp.]